MELSLFNEDEADTIVRAVMILHNKEIIILSKENNFMKDFILFKDQDGAIKRAVTYEAITRDELQQRVDEHKEHLAQAEADLAEYEKLANEVAPAEPAPSEPTPTEPAPAVEPTPTDVPVDTPQPPVEPAPEAPVTPEAPTDTPQDQPAPIVVQ